MLVNFAAESHVDRSIVGAADFIQTNVFGAQQVFEAALRHGVERVVHISTDEVYGSIDEGSWQEDHLLEPNSPYSAAKASSDLIARAYAKSYGLNISITRCSNNYGPYHFPEKVIPLFVTNLLDGLKVPLYGAGANVRDWLFVADHCRGIQLVVEKGRPGEYYNIGGGRELSNRELTEKLLEATDRDWSYVTEIVDPRGGGHDLRYSVDYSKTAELGYAPQMTFEAGPRRDRPVVPRQSGLVGTAEGPGGARAHPAGLARCAGSLPARAASSGPTWCLRWRAISRPRSVRCRGQSSTSRIRPRSTRPSPTSGPMS